MKALHVALIFLLIPVAHSMSLCEDLYQAKKDHYTKKGLRQSKISLILSQLKPSRLAKPEILNMKARKSEYYPTVNSGANIIFSLGPTAEARDSYYLSRKKKYEEVSRKFESFLPLVELIVKSNKMKCANPEKKCSDTKIKDTIRSCQRDVERLELDYTEFKSMYEFLDENDYIGERQTGDKARKYFKSIEKKLKLHWEFRYKTSLQDVFEAIQSEKVSNIIIISHGSSVNGHIKDSDGRDYPVNFFQNLSPALKSLSLYSCHSEKGKDSYKLIEALKTNPSFYTKRILFTVKEKNFNGLGNVVPLKGLKSFVKKVDKYLSKEKWYLAGKRSKDNMKACKFSAKLRGFPFNNTSVFFTLNGVPVKISRESNNYSTKLDVPCNLVKQGKNILFFRNIDKNTTNLNRYNVSNSLVSFSINASRYYFQSTVKVYTKDDMTLRSGRVEFINNVDLEMY